MNTSVAPSGRTFSKRLKVLPLLKVSSPPWVPGVISPIGSPTAQLYIRNEAGIINSKIRAAYFRLLFHERKPDVFSPPSSG